MLGALCFVSPGDAEGQEQAQAQDQDLAFVQNDEQAVLELRRKKTEVFRSAYFKEAFEKLLVSCPEVKTRVERVYDEDQDLTIQENEMRAFFKDVCATVERRGNFSIKTSLLRLFDINDDGCINISEARYLEKLL